MLKKYYKELIVGSCIILVYFLTRLILLNSLPIFTDEAIYIRWSQVALHDANWRFISLTDGKQPLQTWLMMGYLKLVHDPLLAGRLLSVSSGFFTMVGVGFLTKLLFKKNSTLLMASLFYVFYPLAVFHDRLAIEDSLVAMFYIWSLIVSILLVRRINLGLAYTLGFVFSGGVLTKSIGFISMALLPLTLLDYDFQQKSARQKFYKLIVFGLFSVIIGLVFYNSLRLSSFFGIIGVKNSTFVYPFSEWIHHPFASFVGNISALFTWFVNYFNFGYLLLLVVGLLAPGFYKQKIMLLGFFLPPFLFLGLFGKVIFPRYILFPSIILLPVVAYGAYNCIVYIHKKLKTVSANIIQVIVPLLAVIPTVYVSFYLTFDPIHAPIPSIDRYQYIADWPAGWGVKEAIAYLEQVSQSQHIFVGTQGTFGLMPFAFEMYFYNDPNITTKSYWPIQSSIPADLLESARKMPTFIYFYEPSCSTCATGVAPDGWPVVPVFTLTKPDTRIHVTLYRVLPSS